ncbi:MAG: DUF2269 family protein [Gaiellaceae bacterium]
MITLYGVLLFLHILGAGVWFGGEAAMFGLRALALRSGDRARAVALIRDTDRFNKLVISPAVGVLLGAGFWLVLEGHWGFDRFFVVCGLAGFAASSLLGGVVAAPGVKAIQKAVELRGADSPEVGSLTRRIQLGLLLDVLILTAIVFVMATKPTL